MSIASPLPALSSQLILCCSMSTTQKKKINVEKQRDKYFISTYWCFMQSASHIKSSRSSLHPWEVYRLRESLEIWMAGTCDRPRLWSSQCCLPDLGHLSVHLRNCAGLNYQYQTLFRLLQFCDIISVIAEKVLSFHLQTTSAEWSINNVCQRIKSTSL